MIIHTVNERQHESWVMHDKDGKPVILFGYLGNADHSGVVELWGMAIRRGEKWEPFSFAERKVNP